MIFKYLLPQVCGLHIAANLRLRRHEGHSAQRLGSDLHAGVQVQYFFIIDSMASLVSH